MKRILVPVDFSECSEQALQIAAHIARKNNCELILLHLLELPHQGNDIYGNLNSLPEIIFYKDKAISRLEELMDVDYLKDIEVSEAFEIKKVTDGIIDSSIINHVDLIVMGTNGTSGFKELLIGSNTEKVVRLSDIPVLVIKKGIKNFSPKKIVFATDFSKKSKKPFRKMIEFAKIFNSEISLVLISTPSNFITTPIANKIIAKFMSHFEIENYTTHIYNDTNVENGILNFADSIDSDLIGLCTRGRTGLNLFYNGSISEDIVNHAERPVITFKIK